VVLEQGELFQPGNSTSHAPENIFQTNFSRTMTKFAQYSIELFSRLQLDDQPCYYPVGGMEVAINDERYEDLKRKLGVAKSWGTEAKLVSAEEACGLVPLLDRQKIKGAYYVPNDGVVKAVRASEAMAREAQAKGVRFIGKTKVMGIGISGGRVREVITDRDRITADNVLICAGIWGPKVARMAGMTLPLSPMEHLYAKTGPLEELKGENREVVHPVLRHQDRSMYFRQHGDSYGIGSYNHEPLLVDAEDILPHGKAPIMPSIREFTPEHFTKAREAANELMPALKKAELVYKINGMFSFTIDGFPILGQWREVEGLWIAEAIWIMHSGGVGKVMAEWMVDGVPSLDLRECDVNRFHAYAFNVSYIKARAAQQYREVYDVIHPMQPIKFPRNLRLTPFHSRLASLGAEFFENAGWERPQWFRSNEKYLSGQPWPVRSGWEARFWSPAQGYEHFSTRNDVAAFDMTPFTKIEVEGPGSLNYLQYLCVNNIDVPIGKVVYTSMLNSKGGLCAT
jgi:dimethylglycine oxidase